MEVDLLDKFASQTQQLLTLPEVWTDPSNVGPDVVYADVQGGEKIIERDPDDQALVEPSKSLSKLPDLHLRAPAVVKAANLADLLPLATPRDA